MAEKKIAIVLLRHGIDFDKKLAPKGEEHTLWEYKCREHNGDGIARCSTNDHWNYYFKDPDSQKVQIVVRRLDTDGRSQSMNLALILPNWLEKNGYHPIGNVVTKDPRVGKDRTQNPFQTIVPLVKEMENKIDPPFYVKLNFSDDLHEDDLTYTSLVDKRSDYSTLLCWDCQGLWGNKVDGNWPATAADGSIFKILVPDQIHKNPDKGEDIYIITYYKETKKFKVEHQLKLSELVYAYWNP